jgi:hypothetical protein
MPRAVSGVAQLVAKAGGEEVRRRLAPPVPFQSNLRAMKSESVSREEASVAAWDTSENACVKCVNRKGEEVGCGLTAPVPLQSDRKAELNRPSLRCSGRQVRGAGNCRWSKKGERGKRTASKVF